MGIKAMLKGHLKCSFCNERDDQPKLFLAMSQGAHSLSNRICFKCFKKLLDGTRIQELGKIDDE